MATQPEASPMAFKYVPLGDSYTIGTSVKGDMRWPNLLVQQLRPDIELEVLDNLAVNGYTTADLIDDELPQLESQDAEFVSLLIGVNDVVRRVSADDYRANLGVIFEAILAKVPADRIVVVSTPDYTLTPQGGAFGDPAHQRERIDRFNEILMEESEARGIAFVDISPVADKVVDDPSLVAQDGLHPSGKQYANWVEIIAPVVRGLLASP